MSLHQRKEKRKEFLLQVLKENRLLRKENDYQASDIRYKGTIIQDLEESVKKMSQQLDRQVTGDIKDWAANKVDPKKMPVDPSVIESAQLMAKIVEANEWKNLLQDLVNSCAENGSWSMAMQKAQLKLNSK